MLREILLQVQLQWVGNLGLPSRTPDHGCGVSTRGPACPPSCSPRLALP